MDAVESVEQLDDQHLHWRVRIGTQVREWDAEITEQIPDKRIAWHGTGHVPHGGVVTFHRIADDRSRVALQLEFEPSDWKESAADFLGIIERQVEHDLERFKQFMESRGQETGAWRGAIPSKDDAPPAQRR
jgi:uncharacterized membrane protein